MNVNKQITDMIYMNSRIKSTSTVEKTKCMSLSS